MFKINNRILCNVYSEYNVQEYLTKNCLSKVINNHQQYIDKIQSTIY